MKSIESKVQSFDLDKVMKSLQVRTGMSEQTLHKSEKLYRQYLTLRAMYPDMLLSPPQLADEVWHEHLKHSEQYFQDCEEVFGFYLHHHTEEDESLLQQAWANTKVLFYQTFGVNLSIEGLCAARCR